MDAMWEEQSKRKGIDVHIQLIWASLVAETVNNLPAVLKSQVQSLGQENPLGKGMATHSNTFAWRIPWTEEPSRPQSIGL